MSDEITRRSAAAGLAAAAVPFAAHAQERSGPDSLLHVSFDPTRELFDEFNEKFAGAWARDHRGAKIRLTQSHGGSGRQARAVIDGLKADVVSLALAHDVDQIAARGLIAPGWRARLPHGSVPFYSTIVFLVRRGNPKAIRDWGDLVRPGVGVVTPNPKTSGGARWNYLAAWDWAQRRPGAAGGSAGARAFMERLFANVPVLDTGARAATTSFAQRRVGDVLLTWEAEAHLALNEMRRGGFEIVYPGNSIRAEPVVSVVDANVDAAGSRRLADRYLAWLFTDYAQAIAARHHFRPQSGRVMAQWRGQFPEMALTTVEAAFGGWAAAHRAHFAEGAIFDQVISRRR